MQYLSHATGDPRYAAKANRALARLLDIAANEQLSRKVRPPVLTGHVSSFPPY